MFGSCSLTRWTGFFLFTTVLTYVTGFYFPETTLTTPRIFGIASLVVLAPTVLAPNVFGLRGFWWCIYVAGAVIVSYLNVFVAVVQSFAKIPALKPLAPMRSEPPFLITEGAGFVVFVALGNIVLVLFHPERRAAA